MIWNARETQSPGTIFLSCADPRVVPERMFNMDDQHPAGIIRNAGGRAFDAVRSLETLHAIAHLGNIIVVHHTGMANSC